MKKHILALCLTALLIVLASCASMGAPVLYADAEHEHVYGFWYDEVVCDCRHAGEQVRYCKVCLAEQRQDIPISENEAERKHSIENGSCTACGYTP